MTLNDGYVKSNTVYFYSHSSFWSPFQSPFHLSLTRPVLALHDTDDLWEWIFQWQICQQSSTMEKVNLSWCHIYSFTSFVAYLLWAFSITNIIHKHVPLSLIHCNFPYTLFKFNRRKGKIKKKNQILFGALNVAFVLILNPKFEIAISLPHGCRLRLKTISWRIFYISCSQLFISWVTKKSFNL